jgi:hypothetical protein
VGVLDRFEKGIERAVSGAFAKAFRSEVQPVEIASALQRQCDDRSSVVGRNRTIAPNGFVVELGPSDYERLGEWKEALGDELTAVVHDHARQQRYAFVGPVTVIFEEAQDLDTGRFRVSSATIRPSGEPQHRSGAGGEASGGAPDAGPRPGVHQPDPYPAAGHGQAPAAGYGQAPAAGYGQAPAAGHAQDAYHPGSYAPADADGSDRPASNWSPDDPTMMTTAGLEVDGRRHPLSKQVTVLGRASDADVVLDDPGVSRRHAEVHLIDGRARVIDLGSTNGTFVDGERVHAGDLTDGSSITIGRSRITFHSGQW